MPGISKLRLLRHLASTMGWKYVLFRTGYELRRKTGLLRKSFPASPPVRDFISLKQWRSEAPAFFFDSKSSIAVPKHQSASLEESVNDLKKGRMRYFSSETHDIGTDYDWVTNPTNDYRYDVNQHWTEIEHFSEASGDIKYVWEKSRFSFLYPLIRHDYHFGADHGEWVFSEIERWISANPINHGPNYVCSQEISLRILNWTVALHYYKQNAALTESRFQSILHYVYWQLKHVHENIQFSMTCVRNNHALTETLMLYLGGLLFPFFPESEDWKRQGKEWFEREIAYQIYDDGTFIQHSHNYHRIVVQLLTWAFFLAEAHGDSFSNETYDRAWKSLIYLRQCMDDSSGFLPNYGANDGALFFPLSDCEFRDFRPQLNGLHSFFHHKPLFEGRETQEDSQWLGSSRSRSAPSDFAKFTLRDESIASFPDGGCHVVRDTDTLTFIRCASYRDRPSQADNLHVDIWHQGENILRDGGTFKYNAEPHLVHYFTGTSAHNTVTLGDNDQMEKGPRFLWLEWSRAVSANLAEEADEFVFHGRIHAFRHVGSDIFHTRTIKKKKAQPHWVIEDNISHDTRLPLRQIWNPGPGFERFQISSVDSSGNEIKPLEQPGYYAKSYGHLENTTAIVFETTDKQLTTTIQLRA